MMLIQHTVNSDWLFNAQSRVLHVDWLIFENNEKATLIPWLLITLIFKGHVYKPNPT